MGIVLGGFEYYGVGLALIFAGTGSMLAAALVLLLSSPDKARAAVTQGILPLIAIVLLGVGGWGRCSVAPVEALAVRGVGSPHRGDGVCA